MVYYQVALKIKKRRNDESLEVDEWSEWVLRYYTTNVPPLTQKGCRIFFCCCCCCCCVVAVNVVVVAVVAVVAVAAAAVAAVAALAVVAVVAVVVPCYHVQQINRHESTACHP